MQSECLAVSPNLIYSYAWKVPAARPVLVKPDGYERPRNDLPRPEHPSLPWKAYISLREFQNLAFDLAEAFFAQRPPSLQKAEAGPSVVEAGLDSGKQGGRGLLEPVLASRPETAQALAA